MINEERLNNWRYKLKKLLIAFEEGKATEDDVELFCLSP